MSDAFYEAQLVARKIAEDTGMTMTEIAALPVDEWARLSGRPTPAEAAHRALEAQVPGLPHQEPAPEPEQPAEPPGRDVSQLSMGEYARLRGQLGMGRSASAYGIFGN